MNIETNMLINMIIFYLNKCVSNFNHPLDYERNMSERH